MNETIPEKDRKKVRTLIAHVFGVAEYQNITRLGGLTNRTYKITMADGNSYAVRIPGEGTEAMINRADEKVSTELACRLGIDAPVLYFGEDGSKVSIFIRDAETMSVESMRQEANICRAAGILRRLHSCGENTNIPFDVFEMAASYEAIIEKNGVALYDDYQHVKDQVMQIKAHVDMDKMAMMVPCHNDPLSENWVMDSDRRMYLIDWEYAGMNDPMWDLADVSIEAEYENEHDLALLTAYLCHAPHQKDTLRFQANKLYLDFLWTLWGKTRVPFDGELMEQYAAERYCRLKRNLQGFAAL